MTANVNNFFLFELPIIAFFFSNVVLVMNPNVYNFFLFELPLITFFLI